ALVSSSCCWRPEVSQILFSVLIGAVGLERLAELVVARSNTQWALRHGGQEVGQGHYAVMVVLHSGLLAGVLVEVWLGHPPFIPALGWVMVALVVAAQGLRWW